MQIKLADGTTESVASSGVGTAGLTLGIIGTGLAAMSGQNGNGLLGGLFGGGASNVDLKAQIAKLESQKYTDSVGIDLYKQTVVDNKAQTEVINQNFRDLYGFVLALDKNIAVQNAANTAQFTCLGNRVTALEGMTQLYIPSSNVTPTPMNMYNSWTAPTAA